MELNWHDRDLLPLQHACLKKTALSSPTSMTWIWQASSTCLSEENDAIESYRHDMDLASWAYFARVQLRPVFHPFNSTTSFGRSPSTKRIEELLRHIGILFISAFSMDTRRERDTTAGSLLYLREDMQTQGKWCWWMSSQCVSEYILMDTRSEL